MSKVIKTEYTNILDEIKYEVFPGEFTNYKFYTTDYGTDNCENVECASINIDPLDDVRPDRIGVTSILNMVLFDLRLKQIGDYPDRKNDRAIEGVLLALRSLNEK